MQRARAGVYVLAVAIAFLFRALGVFDIPVGQALLNGALGIGSAVALGALAARRPALYHRLRAHALWLALDVALVSWGVAASGGLASPWYLWYLANAGAGAFAAGRRGALWVSVGNAAGYLGVLAVRGEIGLFDQPCLVALARMAFLHGAASFFVRGVADLSARRLEIKRLRDADVRRLRELERLADALDHRSLELSAANRRIREADRQKSRFLANVSHELRTPLNSILGFSQILGTRFAADLPENARRFLGNIRSSGEHLLQVVDDVLDLSKIEAGRLVLAPAALEAAALAEEVVAFAQGQAAPRGIVLTVDVPPGIPPFEADRLKVKQVLLNLLANAIRFSPDFAPVGVSARFLAAADSPLRTDTVRLQVRDEGPGIAPEDQALIFDEFRQARHRAGSGGTGLGLSLVKSLVELHGGRVGLASAPGSGSTFQVDFPVRFHGAPPRGDDDSSSGDLPVVTPPRVLLVDEAAPGAVRAALEEAGCLAIGARPGRDAVRLSRTLRPAALVVLLENEASWDVLTHLADDPDTHDIPAVLCAADEEGRLVALAADELAFGPLRCDAEDPSARLLAWGRPEGPARGAVVVASLAEARAACLERSPDLAILDAGEPDALLLGVELSRSAAATGAPRIRLHVTTAEARDRLGERLAALAPVAGARAAALVPLVLSAARRALARTGPG